MNSLWHGEIEPKWTLSLIVHSLNHYFGELNPPHQTCGLFLTAQQVVGLINDFCFLRCVRKGNLLINWIWEMCSVESSREWHYLTINGTFLWLLVRIFSANSPFVVRFMGSTSQYDLTFLPDSFIIQSIRMNEQVL